VGFHFWNNRHFREYSCLECCWPVFGALAFDLGAKWWRFANFRRKVGFVKEMFCVLNKPKSADLMARNLDRRIECFFPVTGEPFFFLAFCFIFQNKQKGANKLWLEKWVFDLTQSDNVKRRTLHADGTWVREKLAEGQQAINCQDTAVTQLVKRRSDFENKPQDTDAPNASLKKLVKAATKRLV
jgi:hypothetical protein